MSWAGGMMSGGGAATTGGAIGTAAQGGGVLGGMSQYTLGMQPQAITGNLSNIAQGALDAKAMDQAKADAKFEAFKLKAFERAGQLAENGGQSSIPQNGFQPVMTPQGGWYIGDSTRYTSARG